MPWILKALMLAAKSKRGRELLFAGAVGGFELARSERARKVYQQVRTTVADPRMRASLADALRNAANRVKR